MERGDDEVGPYQSPMEDGMQQFHEWYRKAMQARCAVTEPAARVMRQWAHRGWAMTSAPLLMVLATLLFAVMGVAVKYASAHYGSRRDGVLPQRRSAP